MALNILDIARDNLKYRRFLEYLGLLNYLRTFRRQSFPDIYLVDYYPAVGDERRFYRRTGDCVGSGKLGGGERCGNKNVDATGVYHNSLASKITASDWRVYHLYFTWPTQSIPDTDTIDSATASFFHTTDSLVDADNSNIYLVANNQFSATALQADDFVDLGAINLATAALDITG